MPVFLFEQLNEDTVLAVWDITEKKAVLHQYIGDSLTDNQPKEDHIHWLASRALLKHVFPDSVLQIHKDEFNKPSLMVNGSNYHLSITHSHRFAAVILSHLYPVAIDIEKLDDRIIRVKNKFMRDDEFPFINDAKESVMLTTIWSAKETLYKYYGKKELDFREHLKIEPFTPTDNFIIYGEIKKNETRMKKLIRIKCLEGFVLSYISD